MKTSLFLPCRRANPLLIGLRISGALAVALLSLDATARAQNLAVKFYDTQKSFGYAIKNSLVEASDHNFYAPTANRIARLTPEGIATVVYTFSDLAADGTNLEGQQPVAGLMAGHDGNLYGLTSKGGANGVGTVYRFITATGTVQTVASLLVAPYQYGSVNPLVQDSMGNFYYLSVSFTNSGGSSTEVEAIMKVTPAGVVSMLHAFAPPDTNGKTRRATIPAPASSLTVGTTSTVLPARAAAAVWVHFMK